MASDCDNVGFVAVLIAIRGIEPEYWKVSESGRVVIDSDGHSQWHSDRQRNHRYVSILGRPDRLELIVDELMTGPSFGDIVQ